LGDSEQIQQILLNYLTNAIKFTDYGSIRVEGRVEPRMDGRVNAFLAVHDTGTGIPDEAQSALFQPFKQVDPSSTRRHGGVGLGLALCRQIAELMHGTVGARSIAGKGSTFWLCVPLSTVEPSGKE
jgi:signal transduction histidine kinase